jgi:tetratricopeptide (TPR) repeat protein
MRRMLFPLMFLVTASGAQIPARPQQVEGLVNIRFQPDVRTFAVMAAINAGGFDLGAERLEGNPARRLVRERLSSLPADLRGRLSRFYAAHGSEGSHFDRQIGYISYALLLKGPPEFSLAVPPGALPAEAAPLVGFEHLLRELWAQDIVPRLWAEVRPLYAAEAESYRPLIRDMILETLRYLRIHPRVSLDRRVTFMPEPLNANGIVNARNVGEDYFVVVGPSRTGSKLIGSVRHEYLHFLLDPLVAKYQGRLPDAEPFLKQANRLPDAVSVFKADFRLMVSESLIRAGEARLRRPDSGSRSAAAAEDYRQGLILTPYFEEALDKFERGSSSILDAVPEMLEAIQWDVESRRAEVLEAQRHQAAPSPRGAKGAAAAPSPSSTRQLLERANALLMAREFEEAEPVLHEVLRLDSANPGALFGLAQIAARTGEADRALELYESAAANASGQVWIAAWCCVHRGNIYLELGEIGRAREEWNRVLRLEGNLRGAAEAAAKALEEHPAPPR